MSKTFSICNKCYKKIPAEIHFLEDVVYLHKTCCEEEQKEIIEKDAGFYLWLKNQLYTNIMGNSCAISITDKCNTTCEACYAKILNKEKSVDEVVGLARSSPTWIEKFVLTGGEPTVHSSFFDIVSRLNCGIITNGIKFKNLDFLKEYIGNQVYYGLNELSMMLSLNLPGSRDYEAKIEALENIHSLGLKVHMLVVTITSLDQIPIAMKEFEKLRKYAKCFKIRAAFNVGEAHGFSHIYISEMFEYLQNMGKDVRAIRGLHTNTYLLNLRVDGMHLILVKCPDRTTLDLNNIGPTGPYIYTHLDTFEDIMVGTIINEGIEKGYFNGRRLDN